jgi:hypothetical protein
MENIIGIISGIIVAAAMIHQAISILALKREVKKQWKIIRSITPERDWNYDNVFVKMDGIEGSLQNLENPFLYKEGKIPDGSEAIIEKKYWHNGKAFYSVREYPYSLMGRDYTEREITDRINKYKATFTPPPSKL